MTVHTQEPAIQSAELPFPPSWIDRLIGWIDRLPGPVWLFYALSILSVAVLGNAVFWIDGSVPVGSFDPLNSVFAVFVFYWLALYQYLTRIGSRALQTFRPLLDLDDSGLDQLQYELATLPRRLGWLTVLLGIILGVADFLDNPSPFGEIVPQTALPLIWAIPTTGLMVTTFFCVVVRSIRQLRMVHKLQSRATRINLLKLEPAHAFSALTARTGIGIILVVVFGFLFDTSPILTPLDIATYFVTMLLSIAVFAVPVMGMRDHLEAEKETVLNETSDLLQETSASLHSKIGKRDYDGLEGMETAIRALIRERELFSKISTWPWGTRTIRGFASALLLPIFLWLVTRLLERFL